MVRMTGNRTATRRRGVAGKKACGKNNGLLRNARGTLAGSFPVDCAREGDRWGNIYQSRISIEVNGAARGGDSYSLMPRRDSVCLKS